KSIILDLRGNPGGLLDVAVDICDKFLKKDLLIVSTMGKEISSEKKYFAKEEPLAGKEKLIVLINGSSASASEIVAGAIQDHDRGVILGTQSFGKGLVQTIMPLSFNTSLKITTAKYYTPSGRCIQKIDYSKDNDVISEPDSLKKDVFSTDNKRIVYSAGAITPDTIVQKGVESDLLNDLLAKGKIFNFADDYYYENEKSDFNKLNDEKILTEFKGYLSSSKYKYESDVEKKINEVVNHLKENHSGNDLSKTLQKLKAEVSEMFEMEFKENRDQILSELKVELASRFTGKNGAIIERLKTDNQFNTAFQLLKNEENYAKLLTNRNNN
ncbi:MAG: S41 family peptidase, partial [Ignavibacteria bacterium]|nr:S41 family peptidase [Ignavibacteria bacterium]